MKTLVGQVLSVRMAKTAVVGVRRTKIHPLYKKRTVIVRKYHVHDELGVKVGDQVEFSAGRPMAKTKKWFIRKILGKEQVKESVK